MVALLTLLVAVPAIPAYWLLTALCWVAALAMPLASTATIMFRMALGLVLGSTALLHALLRGTGNTAVLAADVMLIAAVLSGMARSARSRRKSPEPVPRPG